jgi:DNA end-binding protein Ku
MAPRANWKGFLKLSLVTCPVALFPATSETEKVTFNQINKQTGHRIKYTKVDAETGDEVPSEDIIKGYKVDTDTYVTVDKDELENIALESTRTIDIDEFVPRSEIDELYLVRPYYIVPDGKVGHDAYAVIRETIRTMDKVAIARVVLTNREHIIALEARGKGLVGMLLRYPYEIRDENEYFYDIQDVKVTREMLVRAARVPRHLRFAARFQPSTATGSERKTTSPKTWVSDVSNLSQAAKSGSRQSRPKTSCAKAICRASSSVSAATMATWRLARLRSLSAAGAKRNNERVSRTSIACSGTISSLSSTEAISPPSAAGAW